MTGNIFQGRQIQILDVDDLSVDQRAFEFTDPAIPAPGSHFAVVVPDDGTWNDAVVRISPAVNEVPVDLLLWAIAKAKEGTRL
ncbi:MULTISPECIES: hypothetical protein [Nocardia]|uniref:hypothetical protein n=1 Tax=Nocardia TaxID=1817 RepID=UPI0005926EC8|nr:MULTISPECIES: hypothetical protein [Nocardia]